MESPNPKTDAFPGSANLPVGVAHQETECTVIWHSRGYIPHFDQPGALQHVTFHLADSLPKRVIEALAEELRHLEPDRRLAEKRKRLEAWIDAGHGDCVLRRVPVAQHVQDCLLWFDGQRYRLMAWVVMPNHVHTLIQTINGWPLAKIVASWKKFTARKICEYRRNLGTLTSGATHPVWQREYWDRLIRDEKHLRQAVEYIHFNPVKVGLAKSPDEWRWGSAYANREVGAPGEERVTPH